MTSIKVIKTTNLAQIALENFAQNSNHLFITSTRSLNFRLNENKNFSVGLFNKNYEFYMLNKTLKKLQNKLKS